MGRVKRIQYRIVTCTILSFCVVTVVVTSSESDKNLRYADDDARNGRIVYESVTLFSQKRHVEYVFLCIRLDVTHM